MKHGFWILTSVLMAGIVSGEIKRSSRNLEPLKKNSQDTTASATSQKADASFSKPPEEVREEAGTKFLFEGPKAGWGFVKAPCLYYSPAGKKLGALPGGLLFKYSDVKATSQNSVLVSTVKKGDAWEGPYLLDCVNVAAYEGDPDKVSQKLIQNLGTYFDLLGKIADRKAAVEEAALAANPHAEAVRQAQKAFDDSAEKAAVLAKQAAAQTGTKKAQTDDALRALKYEQLRLKTTLNKETAALKKWQTEHADPSALSSDAQLLNLKKALEAARQPVAALIPADNP